MTLTRKEMERQQRRELLLDAATRVFGQKPFDEASMQEVAAEAQIGMQGLYEHFPSKQDLYEQVAVRRADLFRAQAEEALVRVEGQGPLAQLRALAEAYVRHFREQPYYLPIFIRDRAQCDWGLESRFKPRFLEIYQAEWSRLMELLRAAVASGEIQDGDMDFLAHACLGILEASLYVNHRQQRREDVATCVDRAMACFLNGMGGSK